MIPPKLMLVAKAALLDKLLTPLIEAGTDVVKKQMGSWAGKRAAKIAIKKQRYDALLDWHPLLESHYRDLARQIADGDKSNSIVKEFESMSFERDRIYAEVRHV